RDRVTRVIRALGRAPGWTIAAYAVAAGAIVVVAGSALGREIFPQTDAHVFQLRVRAPAGTMFESTERLALGVLQESQAAAGPDQVDVTLGYVGVQPSAYPINTIFLWTGGSHEAVLQIALRRGTATRLDRFEDALRGRLAAKFPGARFSFEPGDMVSRI